jgi:hypothetical protein
MQVGVWPVLLVTWFIGAGQAHGQTVRDVASDGITNPTRQQYLLGTGVSINSWSRTGNNTQFGVFDDAPTSITPFPRV